MSLAKDFMKNLQKCLFSFTFSYKKLFYVLLWNFSIFHNNFLNNFFLFHLPSPDSLLPRNSKNYFFLPSLFDFSGFSLYQAEVSFGSIHSSSLSSLSLSESVNSIATRRAKIDATSWRFDCFWWRMSSRSCSTLRSLIPKSWRNLKTRTSWKFVKFYRLEFHALDRLARNRRCY